MQPRKVAVVGAGFAGISAARVLLQDPHSNTEVVVLEASERVGGRAYTVSLSDCGKVEYGATWFHGIVGNPLFEHAVRLGLIDRKEAESSETTWGVIKFLRENEAKLLNEEEASLIMQARDEYSQAVEASLAAADKGAPAVIGHSIRQAYHQAMQNLSSASTRARALFTAAWAWREKLQRSMDGCHTTDDMSAISLSRYEECEGPNVPLPSGYQILAEKLAEGLPIKHGTSVLHIDWSGNGVKLHCSDGKVVLADAAIVTVSLGVLKAQHDAMFQPALPQATAAAIDRLGFGIVDKLFIDFGAPTAAASVSTDGFSQQGLAGGSNSDQTKAVQHHHLRQGTSDNASVDGYTQPLGHDDVVSYSLLWNHGSEEFEPQQGTQAQMQHLDFSKTSADCSSETASKGPGDKAPESHVMVAANGKDATGQSSATHSAAGVSSTHEEELFPLPTWAQGAYTLRFAGSEFVRSRNLDAAAASHRCGVMWITGEFAQGMESCSDTELQQGVAAILQRFPALQLPKNFKVHRSVWGSDPLFRGSYSYGSAKATGKECEALSEPLLADGTRTPVLLFAGEACHPQYFGCTHGAYLTGQSQARALLDAWNAAAHKIV